MDNRKTILLPTIHKRTILHLGTLLWLALLPGCRVIYRTAAPDSDYYYLNPHKNLPAVGSVTIVELDNDSSYPQISADMTEAIFQALQKEQLFSVTVVRQNDPAWRGLQMDTNSAYTLEQLCAMRKALKCNAIMTGTVTTYQPYPHLTIGLKLKLVDLNDGQLLWALEQIWDTTDKTTETRIKNYFQTQMPHNYASCAEQLVGVSSLKFVKFVAYEVTGTL